MVYIRVLFVTLGPLLVLYYLLVALQLFSVVEITKKEIKFPKALIPFYYFFV